MAQFRFIGQHTNGRDRINMAGVEFVGDKASEVEDEVDIDRFRRNPEFEEVDLDPPQPSESDRARQANAEIAQMRADPAPEAKEDRPSLFGKNKAALLEIAAAEGADVPADAKAKDIAAAIKANRG